MWAPPNECSSLSHQSATYIMAGLLHEDLEQRWHMVGFANRFCSQFSAEALHHCQLSCHAAECGLPGEMGLRHFKNRA